MSKARWIITFEPPHSHRLHFTGAKFALKGKSQKFSSEADAKRVALKLLGDHKAILSRGKLRIEKLRDARFHKNPSGFQKAVDRYSRELDDADDRLLAWSGHSAHKVSRVTHKPIKAGFEIGPLLGVMYRAKRDGETLNYRHMFKQSSRPLLVSNSDGSQIAIVGGRYQFTDRGIEDK